MNVSIATRIILSIPFNYITEILIDSVTSIKVKISGIKVTNNYYIYHPNNRIYKLNYTG
jgi:hypothetical protein